MESQTTNSDYKLWRKANLVYLVFAFFPMVLNPQLRGDWVAWAATLLAIALFLPIYWVSYTAPPSRQLLACGAIAALGLALTPFNYGGNTLLIFAMAAAGYGLPWQRAVLVGIGVVIAYAATVHLSGIPQIPTLMLAVIGGMVLLGAIMSRLQERRNAEMKLTQDEVKRLARMAERERIGRDLHDLLGHTLSLIAIKSELAGKLLSRDASAAAAQIADIESIARKALGEVREAVTGIRATGFAAELAAARLSLLSAGVSLDSKVEQMPELAADIESALAMSLREAVTNVVRHAQADRVEVELESSPRAVLLQISDDGRGATIAPGNGLTGMRERVEKLGGQLSIDSAQGVGTRLRIWLPMVAVPA